MTASALRTILARWTGPVCALHAMVCMTMTPASGQVEPQAKRLLADMVRAYRSLRSLDMQTTYTGDPGSFTKPVSSRLAFRRPNRLLYEVRHNNPSIARVTAKRYVCDGRSFYIHDEGEQYYTRDKAPRSLKDLVLAGASLEYAALSGHDPFKDLEREVRAARVEGIYELDGEPVTVVLLDTGTAERTAEARIFVSVDDKLIRRFTFESIPLRQPEPRPPLEPLNPDDPPEQELKLLPVRFGYDNKVTANLRLPDGMFAWSAPAGAVLYEPLNQMLTRGRDPERPAYIILGKDGKQQKAVTYRDLIEAARKQGKRKR